MMPIHQPLSECLEDKEVIQNLIGQGFFSDVYALCKDHDCNYALRVIDLKRTHLSNEKLSGIAKIEEIASDAKISPKIWTHYKCGTFYITMMERLRGETLAQYLQKMQQQQQPPQPELASKIWKLVKQMHDIGILHNDLLPRNVFITNSGQPMILDFGEAQLYNEPLSQSLRFKDYLSICPALNQLARGKRGFHECRTYLETLSKLKKLSRKFRKS